MSSFSENNVTAGTEIQESVTQKPMQLHCGTGGGPDSSASAIHATTVYQPESVLVTNSVNLNVVMNDQNIPNGAYDEYVVAPEPVVCQPEVVVTEAASEEAVQVTPVMNATAVVSSHAAYEEAVQVPQVMNATAVVSSQAASEEAVHNNEVDVTVVADDHNNSNNISTQVVNKILPTSQTNPLISLDGQNNNVVLSVQNNEKDHNNMVLIGNVVVNDENIINQNNNFVTPSVFSNLISNRSNKEVVAPIVVANQNNNINEVVVPSVVSNQNNVNSSNEVVTPTVVVNHQNNGFGNNAVAIDTSVGEAIKRKRGRPRKYPIGEASAVPAVSSPSMAMQSGGPVLVNAQVQGSSEKRGRGRPAGSGKKHKADAPFPFTPSPAISGSIGAGFLPYIITVKSGEYVQPKVLSLSQVDKQVVCVLSASGTISNVTLQQPQSSGGTVTYQGQFEILSLSGSFLQSESDGQRSITGGLSVSLAVPNGCIFGGGVAGPLIAYSDVQIIVGTFLASEQNLTKPGCNNVSVSTAPPNHVSSVGGSPPSRALLSESSSAWRSPFNHSNGGCNNGNQQPVSNVTWM